ncbi:uncharacterized protein LAESUDRAFT_757336 [Laetiporus sulphureus 93-53]|uniref:Uncharacterized protein n=1 Tax=Laetiporus sulphureus 93-53 TaxID=1314785 RepID=A0A165F912_9APHY|nr:uncharacterized protein LAESUDRAFT_757336 [Laetiporus sulphureus 93-53]KZT08615.1 hypothetical protein LAESUDRAFT_757336 [Laetiporus sulphureus 93-53]
MFQMEKRSLQSPSGECYETTAIVSTNSVQFQPTPEQFYALVDACTKNRYAEQYTIAPSQTFAPHAMSASPFERCSSGSTYSSSSSCTPSSDGITTPSTTPSPPEQMYEDMILDEGTIQTPSFASSTDFNQHRDFGILDGACSAQSFSDLSAQVMLGDLNHQACDAVSEMDQAVSYGYYDHLTATNLAYPQSDLRHAYPDATVGCMALPPAVPSCATEAYATAISGSHQAFIQAPPLSSYLAPSSASLPQPSAEPMLVLHQPRPVRSIPIASWTDCLDRFQNQPEPGDVERRTSPSDAECSGGDSLSASEMGQEEMNGSSLEECSSYGDGVEMGPSIRLGYGTYTLDSSSLLHQPVSEAVLHGAYPDTEPASSTSGVDDSQHSQVPQWVFPADLSSVPASAPSPTFAANHEMLMKETASWTWFDEIFV